MADTETKQPLTITARRVAILPVQHHMGAVEWMRKSEEDKASLLASVRAFAVNQADEHFPGCLYAFLPPEVDTSQRLTIAGNQMIDRGCTITAPVFVFEPVVDSEKTTEEPGGFLQVGQTWTHTTGKRHTIIAVNISTRMYGVTNLAEDVDTGELIPVSGDPVDWVNWTQTAPML